MSDSFWQIGGIRGMSQRSIEGDGHGVGGITHYFYGKSSMLMASRLQPHTLRKGNILSPKNDCASWLVAVTKM